MDNMDNILYETKKGAAIIKINRPKAMNSLNEEVLLELERAVEEAEADPEVNLMIITGEGRAFVAGADIASMSQMDEEGGKRLGRIGARVFRKIETSDKPSIAAINGFALGGGCELAMACDMRIASEKAKFGQPEVGLGITPGFSGTQRLPRLIGRAKATELILTGDIINAQEMKELGLLNKVVPHETLMREACALAMRITKNAPLAVRYSNRAIKRGLEAPTMEDAIEVEVELFGKCFATKDQKEGMGAFLENREANFIGE